LICLNKQDKVVKRKSILTEKSSFFYFKCDTLSHIFSLSLYIFMEEEDISELYGNLLQDLSLVDIDDELEDEITFEEFCDSKFIISFLLFLSLIFSFELNRSATV
jgi:hypothetical protein